MLKDVAVNNVGYILYIHEQIKLDIIINCKTELKDTKCYTNVFPHYHETVT